MELTYTDKDFTDLGILKEATCDFAFGRDENDFEIVTTKENAKLIIGGYVYYEDTEYGGIVDSIEVSSTNDEVKYYGRTWHGLLNSFIMNYSSAHLISDGEQYTVIEGRLATSLIYELILLTELPIIVEMAYEGALKSVTVDARQGMYDFIISILRPNGMKIFFRYNNGIHLYVSSATSYDEEHNFDTSQMTITSKKNSVFTNHFLLHNYSESENKHRFLNLYTDASGNIQTYSSIPAPLRDDDYLNAQKILSGVDEKMSLLEDTTSKENYRLEDATISSLNWRLSYQNYYEYVPKEEGSDIYEYRQLKPQEEHVKLLSEPASWSYEWNKFYKKTGTDQYTQLSEEDNTANTRVKWVALYRTGAPPFTDLQYMSAKNWESIFAQGKEKDLYYTRYWDGNQWVHEQAQGVAVMGWERLGSAPSNWSDENARGNYYVDDKYIKYTVKVYQKVNGKKKLRQTLHFDNHNYKNYYIMRSQNAGVSGGKIINVNKKTNRGKLVGGKEIKQQKVPILSVVKKLNKDYPAEKGSSTIYRMTQKIVDNSRVTIKTYQDRRGKGVSSYTKFSERPVYRQIDTGKKKAPAWMEPNNSHSNPKGYFMKKTSSVGIPNFSYLTQQLGYEIYAQYDAFPTYEKNKFFKKVNDHFAGLVEKAKEQLNKELDALKSATVELNVETYEFDVGDIVGGADPLTNEEISSVVTKKIAKIDAFKSEVTYEIG